MKKKKLILFFVSSLLLLNQARSMEWGGSTEERQSEQQLQLLNRQRLREATAPDLDNHSRVSFSLESDQEDSDVEDQDQDSAAGFGDERTKLLTQQRAITQKKSDDSQDEEQQDLYITSLKYYKKSLEAHQHALHSSADVPSETMELWKKLSTEYEIYGGYWNKAAELCLTNPEEAHRVRALALKGEEIKSNFLNQRGLGSAFDYLEKALKARPDIASAWIQAAQARINAVEWIRNNADKIITDQQALESEEAVSTSALSSHQTSIENSNDPATEKQFGSSAVDEADNETSQESYSDLLHKSADYWEKTAEARNAGNEKSAEEFQKIAEEPNDKVRALNQSHSDRSVAEQSAQGIPLAEEAYRKMHVLLAEREKALARGDQEAAALFEKRAAALGGTKENPGAGYAYRLEQKNKDQGKEDAAAAWSRCAQAYEKLDEALANPNATNDVILYEKMALLLGGTDSHLGAAVAYEFAAANEIEASSLATLAWRSCAKEKEKEVNNFELDPSIVLKEQSETTGTRLEKAARILEKRKATPEEKEHEDKLNADYAQEQANQSLAQGNMESNEAWLKCKEAYDASVTEMNSEEHEVADLYRKKATALGAGEDPYSPGAGSAYDLAAFVPEQNEAADPSKIRIYGFSYLRKHMNFSRVAPELKKCAEFRKKEAEALQSAIDSLITEDHEIAQLHKKRAQALGGNSEEEGVAEAYGHVAAAKNAGRTEYAALFDKCATVYKEQADVLSTVIEILSKKHRSTNDNRLLFLHQRRANALGGDINNKGAGRAYALAAKNQHEENKEAVRAYTQAAESYEKQAQHLLCAINFFNQGGTVNDVILRLHQRIANALGGSEEYGGAGFAYERVGAFSIEKKNLKEINMWRQCVTLYEEAAEAFKTALAAYKKEDTSLLYELYEERAKAVQTCAYHYRCAAIELQQTGSIGWFNKYVEKAQADEKQIKEHDSLIQDDQAKTTENLKKKDSSKTKKTQTGALGLKSGFLSNAFQWTDD